MPHKFRSIKFVNQTMSTKIKNLARLLLSLGVGEGVHKKKLKCPGVHVSFMDQHRIGFALSMSDLQANYIVHANMFYSF